MIGRLRGRPGKIAYGFGNLGTALIFHSIGSFLIYFYINEVRLDPALVGLGFLISYGIWNSINDPIAGYISDRTRTRWGRRIPFVLFCTPLMMLFFILLWSPPVGGVPLPTPYNIWIFLYFIVIVGIFELVYTFVGVGWGALFPEMFQDLKERTEVSIYRQVAAMIGSMVGFVLTPLIIASLTGRLGTFSGWTLTGVALGCIGGCAYLTSLLGSRERREFSVAGTLPIKTAFKVTLTNRSFLTAAFCVLMISWIWSLLSAMGPFLVVYMLGGALADVALVSSPIFFMGILFYPQWRKICIRYGTKKTLIIATFLSALFLLPLLLVADTILKATLMMLFYGFANSGVTLVREILMPDVIDEDQIKTGFRREGIYLGVGTFVDRFALALTGASTVLVFSLTGFVPGVPQPSHVILGMRLATAMILIVALLGFLVSMKYYPLGAEKVVEIRRMLEKLHGERAERLKLVAEKREG
ncbi:MAG: glucuronide transporter [Candidatus Bathyarchaeota archaeon BA1]|nr:MAG: glucuronide transporter [Candidatus Bathyarchaeota archaeon BA1]